MRMINTIRILVFLASFHTLHAATDWAAVHEKTMEAIDQLYSLELRTAEKLCNTVIGMAPGDPRGHFIKSMVYYYKMSYDGGAKNDTLYYAFLYHAGLVERVCTALLDHDENDGKAMAYLGGTYGYRGLAKYARGEMLSAVWDGKKGYDLLSRAMSLDPSNADAAMGLGMFRYMIGLAPSEIESAINLVGLKGDKAEGFRLMEQAASRGLYARNEAKRWLVDFYQQEDMPVRAMAHAQALADAYPRNWMFQRTCAQIALYQLRKPEKAAPYGERLISSSATNGHIPVAMYGHQLAGYAEMVSERYASSEAHYEQAYQRAPTDELKQEIAMQRGHAAEISGDRADAMQWYRKAAGRQDAKQRLATPLSASDRTMLRIQYAYQSGRPDRAATLADSARRTGLLSAPRATAVALYFCGAALIESRRYQDAARALEESLRYPELDGGVRPFCHWRLGQCYAGLSQRAAAEEQWTRALSFTDYPAERVLRIRVQRDKTALH